METETTIKVPNAYLRLVEDLRLCVGAIRLEQGKIGGSF
jgi:hypothetical protein